MPSLPTLARLLAGLALLPAAVLASPAHPLPSPTGASGRVPAAAAKPTAAPAGPPVPPPPHDRAATSTFVHPGVFLGTKQMSFISSKVAADEAPWNTALSSMLAYSYATKTTATPFATITCSSGADNDDSCTSEEHDSLTAYLYALAWVATGDSTYSDRAITIMDAWAGVVEAHPGSNGGLQAAWAASSWTRAAEIIRHTGAGWTSAGISAFETMLTDVYMPLVLPGSDYNGNWELVMMEAAQGISVFTDNRTSYDLAMTKYKARAAAYVYLTSDGDMPNAIDLSTDAKIISYWYNQTVFNTSGLCQETCRDFGHVGYGLNSMAHVAETALIQGEDLYSGEIGERLQAALEFHADLELGSDVPAWLCDGTVTLGMKDATEMGYNAMSFRLGNAMPRTWTYTKKRRPAGTNTVFVGWETLSHGNNSASV